MFHGLYVPHVLYPFLCWWASRLLPFPGHCEPRGAWIVVRCLWRCAREWRCGAVWEFRFQLFRRTLRLPSVLAALPNAPVRRVGGVGGPFPPHPLQLSLCVDALRVAVRTRGMCCLVLVLICLPPITNDAEHLFQCPPAWPTQGYHWVSPHFLLLKKV